MVARGEVIKDPFVEFDAVDISSVIREVTVNASQPGVESTASGADGQEQAVGLRQDSFAFTVRNKLGTGEVEEKLWTIFDAASEVTVKVRHHAGAIAVTNPQYTGTVFLQDLTFLGAIASLNTVPVTLPVQGKIARATA